MYPIWKFGVGNLGLEGDIRALLYLQCMWDAHKSKIRQNFFFFFFDGWIELVELHWKKYTSNFKTDLKKNLRWVAILGLFSLIFANNVNLDPS